MSWPSLTYRAMLFAYPGALEKSSPGTKRFQYPRSEYLTLVYCPAGLAASLGCHAQRLPLEPEIPF